jgi:hypothetical protein
MIRTKSDRFFKRFEDRRHSYVRTSVMGLIPDRLNPGGAAAA